MEIRRCLGSSGPEPRLAMVLQARCRMCRCVVISGAPEAVLERHQALAVRPRAFAFKDAGAHVPLGRGCTHLFVQEQAWMEGCIRGVNSGTLPCPRCGAKLGSFCWSGLQCSCGTWVAPALSLVRSKLDVTEATDNET